MSDEKLLCEKLIQEDEGCLLCLPLGYIIMISLPHGYDYSGTPSVNITKQDSGELHCFLTILLQHTCTRCCLRSVQLQTRAACRLRSRSAHTRIVIHANRIVMLAALSLITKSNLCLMSYSSQIVSNASAILSPCAPRNLLQA